MTKKVNIFLILFVFIFGFGLGAFLKHLKDGQVIKQQQKEIDFLKSGRDFDAILLDYYNERFNKEKDSIQ